MNLKRINNADKHAVFGSIEVLGDISGSGIQTIRKNIDALSKSVSTTAAKQDSYWKSIADDSLISPIEKRTLKQEWNTIEQTYASLMTLARENGVEESTEIVNYSLAYNALYAYLTQTLKVFDDMGVATPVADREVFEGKFEAYYENQTFAQNKVVVKQHLNIRELENLNGPGTENEIASYKGMLYMYDTSAHQWKPLDAASYIGAIADNMNFPTAGNGNYFLAIGNRLKTRLFANGVPLLANGSELIINKEVTGGNIYVCDESGNWIEVTDRDNWRYIVAMNDLIKYNFAVSTQFGHYISGQIETKVANATPKYKGPYNSLAQIPECNNGDWFTWAGETTRWDYSEDYFINLEYGNVYKYNKPTWAKLDPTDSRYNNEFMTALIDIVNMNAQGDGYFSTIFAKKIFALEAAIQTLQTKVIELSKNGKIVSALKDANDQPYTYIDAEGNVKLKGNVTIGDDINGIKLISTGATSIGTLEKGIILRGDGNVTIKGQIESGPLILNENTSAGGTGYVSSVIVPAGDFNSSDWIKEGTFDSHYDHSRKPNIKIYPDIQNVNIEGVYDSAHFDNIKIDGYVRFRYHQDSDWTRHYISYVGCEIKLYNSTSLVKTILAFGPTYDRRGGWSWDQSTVNFSPIDFTYINSGTKTFKLIGLPSNPSSEPGVVYQENGFLKIS